MLQRLYARLEHFATPRYILLFMGLFFGIAALLLPQAEARIKSASGGVGPLDLRSSYTPQDALDAVEAYGPDGRSFYALIELTADVIYPVSYGLFFTLLIIALLRGIFPTGSPWRLLALLPLAITLVDFIENAAIVTMLFSHPARPTWAAALAGILTTIKWALLPAALLLVVFGLVGRLWLRLKPAQA